MFYMSGQLPTSVSPADRAKGTPAVYGDTKAQAESTFNKIQGLLKEQGLGMGDVVMMRVYMAAEPAMDKLDFAGMNEVCGKFFGTPEQPNKPARSTVQVAALVTAGALIEVEVQAVRPEATAQRCPGRFRAFAAAGFAAVASGIVLASQAPALSVFTEEQATAGRSAYAKHCASCHMPDLIGNAEVRSLAGRTFIDTWGNRSTKDLFDYMSEAMPYGAPSLSVDSYTSIAAYILPGQRRCCGR
jgi:2-iminobutanoate/2-iminopropanoate deaminase